MKQRVDHEDGEKRKQMTIRLVGDSNDKIGTPRIAALITQSLLHPTDDDAPEVTQKRPGAGWLRWQLGAKTERTALTD